MPLLSKEERKKLSKPEQRQLRKSRRRERKEQHLPSGISRFFDDVLKDFGVKFHRALLDDAIMDAIGDIREVYPDLNRYELLEEVVEEIVDIYDEVVDFSSAWIKIGMFSIPLGKVIETYDGPAIRFLLKGFLTRAVQARFAELNV